MKVDNIVSSGGANTVTVNGALAVNETTLKTFAEGGAGRPRIWGDAMVRPNNGLPILTVSAASTYTIPLGLNVVTGITSTPFAFEDVVAFTITVVQYTGSIRFNITQSAGGSATSTLKAFKNNVLVTTFTTTTGGAGVARSVDISVVPNDVIEWRHNCQLATYNSTLTARFETASDAYVDQAVYKRAST